MWSHCTSKYTLALDAGIELNSALKQSFVAFFHIAGEGKDRS